MSPDEERVMAQIDAYTARETRREQTMRWCDATACPRCGFLHDTPVCGFCGRDRTDTITTTEDDDVN